MLKGLPAPPIRPRKGLRVVEDGESWVPVPGLRSLARVRARSQKDVVKAAGGGKYGDIAGETGGAYEEGVGGCVGGFCWCGGDSAGGCEGGCVGLEEGYVFVVM